jgi:hypothetical protein
MCFIAQHVSDNSLVSGTKPKFYVKVSRYHNETNLSTAEMSKKNNATSNDEKEWNSRIPYL